MLVVFANAILGSSCEFGSWRFVAVALTDQLPDTQTASYESKVGQHHKQLLHWSHARKDSNNHQRDMLSHGCPEVNCTWWLKAKELCVRYRYVLSRLLHSVQIFHKNFDKADRYVRQSHPTSEMASYSNRGHSDY